MANRRQPTGRYQVLQGQKSPARARLKCRCSKRKRPQELFARGRWLPMNLGPYSAAMIHCISRRSWTKPQAHKGRFGLRGEKQRPKPYRQYWACISNHWYSLTRFHHVPAKVPFCFTPFLYVFFLSGKKQRSANSM